MDNVITIHPDWWGLGAKKHNQYVIPSSQAMNCYGNSKGDCCGSDRARKSSGNLFFGVVKVIVVREPNPFLIMREERELLNAITRIIPVTN